VLPRVCVPSVTGDPDPRIIFRFFGVFLFVRRTLYMSIAGKNRFALLVGMDGKVLHHCPAVLFFSNVLMLSQPCSIAAWNRFFFFVLYQEIINLSRAITNATRQNQRQPAPGAVPSFFCFDAEFLCFAIHILNPDLSGYF